MLGSTGLVNELERVTDLSIVAEHLNEHWEVLAVLTVLLMVIAARLSKCSVPCGPVQWPW